MTRRWLAAVPAAIAVALFWATSAFATGNTAQTNIPYDGSPEIANLPYKVPASDTSSGGSAGTASTHEGRAPDLSIYVLDYVKGLHQVDFWKEYSGAHSDIYVGWDNLTPPAESSQQDHTITTDQINYMGREFDEKIWESDVFHFGNYKSRCPGTTAKGKKAATCDGKRAGIFIYNIRDEAYYSSYRFYVAGYFWGALNDFIGLNAVFVDSYNWKDRTTANGSAWKFGYEGVVAHEFEHLIHNDVDPDEDSAIDEGMADLAAQMVYGNSTVSDHIGQYLYYHRDSTSDWDGELYDYGNGVLFQDYLWERAGGGNLFAPLSSRVAPAYVNDKFAETDAKFTDPGDRFVWNLIHDQANNMAGVANQVGGIANARSLHHDFTMANLLDGKVSEPRYNYRNLALGGPDSDGYSIDDGIAFYDSNVTGNQPPTRKNVRRRTVVEPWGGYYRAFKGAEPGFFLNFAGNATDGVAATTLPYHWYSGLGNGLDRTVERTFTVAAGDTLKFNTWFDIEAEWDYGYVEASNGGAWVKLSQISALPTASSNQNASSAWDGAGGFTGNSGGYKAAEFSFGGLTGTVKVRFRYRTDEAVNGQGWYVDDVAVGSTVDNVVSTAGWTTNGWAFTTGQQQNVWTADYYGAYQKGGTAPWSVFGSIPLTTSSTLTSGSQWIDAQYLRNGTAYGVVGNRPDGAFDATGQLSISKSQG